MTTIDTRTEAERRYDAERNGSLYLPPADAQQFAADTALDFPAPIPAQMDDRGYWHVALGTIDGCTVIGHYNEAELYCADLTWHGREVSTDGTAQIHLPASGDCFGDLTLDEWAWTCDLVKSGVGDQLITLARRFDPAPRVPAPFAPVAPPRDVVLVSRGGSDDGEITWTDYTIGDVLVSKSDQEDPHAPGGFTLIIHRNSFDGLPITFDMLASLMIDLSRLLADDRVRAAFGEPPMAAIRG